MTGFPSSFEKEEARKLSEFGFGGKCLFAFLFFVQLNNKVFSKEEKGRTLRTDLFQFYAFGDLFPVKRRNKLPSPVWEGGTT